MPNTLKSGSEDVDIKAVIEAETTAYLNQDVDALCDCWVQEPYLQHTTILPYCGVVQVHGIKGLRNHFVEDFKLETPLKIESQAVGRKNWKIVVRDRMAWVTFEQFVVSDRSGHMSGEQMHTRILEKISGRWKIAASTGVLSRLDFYDCPKLQVDGSGHVKQIDQESRDVIEGHPVLNITGGRLFANTQQDATRLKNALQSAQRNIESGKARMPVPLIFGDDQGSGSPLCWIAILDMKIVILLDDIRLVEATIVSAGEVYGLSATQMRVAEEIAKGEDLTAIADTLDVTTNTIRTHVKRMFDRVGVNSQKALLKRLLSTQVPAVGPHY